ncbi:MAG: hypothetical protein ABI726_03305 [bacterium]
MDGRSIALAAAFCFALAATLQQRMYLGEQRMYLGVHLYYLSGVLGHRLGVLRAWILARFGVVENRVIEDMLPAAAQPRTGIVNSERESEVR